MPKKTSAFSRESIGRAAFELVRERGWEALSARSLAGRMGSSVGPIYSAFGRMEELQSFVLEGATRVFDAFIAGAGSGKTFLDMGIGMARFARDEPLLYRALAENRDSPEGGPSGCLEAYKGRLRSRLDLEVIFRGLDPERRERVFERMWLFGLGLASALVNGYATDRSDGGIAELMSSQGAIVIYGEAAGLGDAGGRAFREAWAALNIDGGKEDGG